MVKHSLVWEKNRYYLLLRKQI